jgi:predicted phage terminase large subunit-like protein
MVKLNTKPLFSGIKFEKQATETQQFTEMMVTDSETSVLGLQAYEDEAEEIQNSIIKKSIDQWLDEVDYRYLSEGSYTPSTFALLFMNFIKLVNGDTPEDHKTPPVHLAMLDKMVGDKDYIANLCFRGASKTTLFFEYLVLFLAFYGYLPGFGEITGMIYVSDSMENGVKSARKNIQYRYENSEFLREWVPVANFTDNYLEFQNKDGHRLGCKMFGAKTGLRGTKIFAKRPVLCVLDDLISDDDANSKVEMQAIKDTVYRGVDYALDPTRRKVIFNGTPFNKDDIMIEAIESGAWDVNVWPVCERWPVSKEEFRSAWPDRFTYDFVKKAYTRAVLNGKVAGFMQELMLRISSEEDRLVQDGELWEYNRSMLLKYKHQFNFYITTDFAVSDKQTADYSVISVWAYNANGDWFWVDGICERQDMSKNADDLFRFVQEYKPQSVGIEITGQQLAFITWFQQQMMDRNIWFNFASSEKSGTPGIRPVTNKLSRFQLVVPLFKARKIFWPKELRASKIMGHFMQQIKLATKNGLKGKDDCIDTVSMLTYMKPWKPSVDSSFSREASDMMGHNGGPSLFDDEASSHNQDNGYDEYGEELRISSYIV